MFIHDKYKESGFWDIILAKRVLDPNLIQLDQITYNYPIYILLHNVLLFSHDKLGWG